MPQAACAANVPTQWTLWSSSLRMMCCCCCCCVLWQAQVQEVLACWCAVGEVHHQQRRQPCSSGRCKNSLQRSSSTAHVRGACSNSPQSGLISGWKPTQQQHPQGTRQFRAGRRDTATQERRTADMCAKYDAIDPPGTKTIVELQKSQLKSIQNSSGTRLCLGRVPWVELCHCCPTRH
ncbi:hypothetical protein COO60DRAFT_804676 [Scenedesmus sp. NREL 46B-D3]|nr:hypothetical protein COO60DRAFT_804676 [Scenedesmus sp. NREL 46B-D3]